MKNSSKTIPSLALSVLKYEIMGKLFSAAITVTILGIATSIDKQGFVLNQILACLVYFPSFYSVLWHEGRKSKKSDETLKGLKVGLFASLPYLLSTVAIVVFKLFNIGVSDLWYRIVNVQYISVYTFLFSGNTLNENSWQAILICFALQLILPLVTQLSYTLGRHDFSLSEHFMYKSKPKQSK